MRVSPGHQCGPRGRTKGGRVKVVVTETVLGKAVDIGRIDQPTKRLRQLGEADVIKQEDEYVRRATRLPLMTVATFPTKSVGTRTSIAKVGSKTVVPAVNNAPIHARREAGPS